MCLELLLMFVFVQGGFCAGFGWNSQWKSRGTSGWAARYRQIEKICR